jgi:hypothetical protein
MWFRWRHPVSAPVDAPAPEVAPEAAAVAPDVSPAEVPADAGGSSAPSLGDHPGTLEHLISEGVLLAEYAGRMALKNHIVVGVLTGSEPYDPGRYCDPARAVLSDLVGMANASASLAVDQREAAETRKGASQHEHDYRSRDAENLRRREAVHTAVAAQLRQVRDDPDYLDAFIERARQDAWSDIGAAIKARLDQYWPSLETHGDPYEARDAERSKQKRLRILRRDLAAMARERA